MRQNLIQQLVVVENEIELARFALYKNQHDPAVLDRLGDLLIQLAGLRAKAEECANRHLSKAICKRLLAMTVPRHAQLPPPETADEVDDVTQLN